jgi:glycosyltransferase involved in cell wall biosynthesis
MNNLISIIVTIYNREDYLKECLDSVKNQTYQNFECLMIDDGSTDNSKVIAEEYAKEDSRFKFIPVEHVGFPEAKNIGLRNKL